MTVHMEKAEEIQNLLQKGEVEQALQASQTFILEENNNPTVCSICSALLINGGTEISRIEPVNFGISLIEEMLENLAMLDDENLVHLHYNLSNGYATQACLFRDIGDDVAAEVAFQKQKYYLQTILLRRDSLPSDLLPNVITNYANLLDHLGRTVEAVDYYYDCLQVSPNHAIAMGNCSCALKRLFNISAKHNPKLLYESWRLLKRACELDNEVIEIGGQYVLSDYLNRLNDLEDLISRFHPDGSQGLEEWITGFDKAHKSWKPSSYLRKVLLNRLLLTVNPILSNCEEEYKDEVFFEKMIVPISDEGNRWFQALCHTLNNIKEDFAIARYFYYQSQSQNRDIIEISRVTSYMDTLDYADFGLRSGLLKASLRLSADLLDKCAVFLNLYLELGHPEDQINFGNFWYKKRKHDKGLLLEINDRLASNHFLSALYDLQRDLYEGRYPFPFKRLRNEATHQRLVLSWYGSLDEEVKSFSSSHFQEVTLSLLRVAKAAIIYIIGTIMVEENHKETHRQEDGTIDLVAPAGLNFNIGTGLSDHVDHL
jgi:tetratricopeptide (TPR) repeat protein